MNHPGTNDSEETAAPDNGIGIPVSEVQQVIERHPGITPWHLYIYKERHTRWDVLAISQWVNDNLPKNAAILSVACGMGYNLYWWARRGFTNLNGFDRDATTIVASQELIERYGFPIRLWRDTIENADHGLQESYDFIEAMNCLMYEQCAYDNFLNNYAAALKPGGILALDAIDQSYNTMPNNQWHTGSLKRPVSERLPNEYKTRFSAQQIVDMTAPYNLMPISTIRIPRMSFQE